MAEVRGMTPEGITQEILDRTEGFATQDYVDSSTGDVDNRVDSVEQVLGDFSPRLDAAESDLGTRLVMGGEVQDGVYAMGPAISTYPGYEGLVMFDNFRNTGEVVGSTSFSGHAWEGFGSWTSNGSIARANGSARLSVDAGQVDVLLDAKIEMSTVARSSAQLYRVYVASTPTGSSGVWLTLSISTTGVASVTMTVTRNGSNRQLVGYTGLFTIGISAGVTEAKQLRIRLSVKGSSVAATLTGPEDTITLTGTLTSEEIENLSTFASIMGMPTESPGFGIREVLVETAPYANDAAPVLVAGVDDSGKLKEEVLPDRLSQSALVQLIKSQQTDSAESGLDTLAAKLAFGGAGQHTIGVVADSTMNDGLDSLRVFDRKLAALLPESVRHVYHNWNTADPGWRHTVNSEGDMSPGHDGQVLKDTFSRTSSSLVGSTPDVGPTWSGAGTWSSDGSVARANGAASLAVNAGNRSMKVSLDLIIDRSNATNQRFDILLAAPSAVENGGVMVACSIGATGSLSFVLYRWEGSWVKVGDSILASSVGLPPGTATPTDINVTLEIDIQNISLSITGPSGTATNNGQLTETQYSNAGTWARIVGTTPDTSAFAVNTVEVLTAPLPPQGDFLEVWNGAIAGARISSFDMTRINSMFSGKSIDTLLLSLGHNNGAQSGEAFAEELEQWLVLWKSLHPETKSFIWVSQNPQFPPAGSIVAHRNRQFAIRTAHRRLGIDYVSGYESISSQPDGGASLVIADGIHPSTPPSGVIEGEYGAVIMADAILTAITDRI